MLHTTSNDPWSILEKMAVHTRQMAHPLPRLIQSATWWGIASQLGNENFFIPLSIIVQILREPRITRIPGMQDWLLGITHLRGELLVVSDLHDFLKKRDKALRDKMHILVIRHEGALYGILVDFIFGLMHFSSEQYTEKVTPMVALEYQPFVKGQLQESNEKVWPLLDLKRIIAMPSFQRASVDNTEARHVPAGKKGI